MQTILLQRVIISCLSVMFYITAIAARCKRHPSNLTNINIVTEPVAIQTEKVTIGETTSDVLPSVKSVSDSLSQEEKENIQELVEAEQVLEAERNLLEQEVNEGRQNPSAPDQWWDEDIYSYGNQAFSYEYSQQPPSYKSSSTTFPADPLPPSYESHGFDNPQSCVTSSNPYTESICDPNDLKDALKHPTYKYQYLTFYLAKIRNLAKEIFLFKKKIKINEKDLALLEKELLESEHKKAILEQTNHVISLDQTFLGDTERVIKIISMSIAIREYEIKYLKKVIQKKKEKKEFDHTNNPNLSQAPSTNGSNLYPDLSSELNIIRSSI
ncbi:hypothetical protein [Cardinium endosymbiont of Bemisia tabaci]|uniref:hypothetical protein n=3 Tax=Cardinium endosymbiont of Bemisia tabaci TaxID=672794 RepID=UPI000552AC41|nr:hypothetical protein [Cardinium endosymbiont of Bemisia tabaci]